VACRRRGLAAGRVRACAGMWRLRGDACAAARGCAWGAAAVLRWGLGSCLAGLVPPGSGGWEPGMSALAAGTGAREGKAGRELGNLGLA
jgi:hypothetical protein